MKYLSGSLWLIVGLDGSGHSQSHCIWSGPHYRCKGHEMGSDYVPGPTQETTAQDLSPRELFALDFSRLIVTQQLINRKKGKISDTFLLKDLSQCSLAAQCTLL